MPSQAVYEFRAPAVRTAAASSKSFYVHGSVVSICDHPAFSKAPDDQELEPNSDGLECARGLRFAFLLELCMVVLAYGIWHWWRLIH